MPVESIEGYVQFPVPKDRVPDVARFLYGVHEAQPEALAKPVSEVPMSREQRGEVLKRIYKESEPKFRKLLLMVAERPDPAARLSYADITAAMPGWDTSRSLPGALGAFGRRTNHRYGGFWPFERVWSDSAWSHFLLMEPDDAAYLVALHVKLNLPLAK